MTNKVPELSILKAGVLQPWGLLNVDVKGDAALQLPEEWYPNGSSLSQRVKHFQNWQAKTMATINRVLWPRFDSHPKRRVWIGESTRFMPQLTITDLELMGDIRKPESGIRHFRTTPQSPLRSLTVKDHWFFFEKEDGSGIFSMFEFYCQDASDQVKAAMVDLCFVADATKQPPVNFLFKNALQRPRPMQTALRFGFLDFEYEYAKSSVTPSMCSGHCLQGVLEVGAALERLMDDGVPLSKKQLESIGQWGVDIGDRRVMAGVHYPSDNICSWFIFLRMADFIYHQPDAPRVMAYAIRHLSFVYKQLHRWIDMGKGQVYASALATVDSELDRLLRGFQLLDRPGAGARVPAGSAAAATLQFVAPPVRSGNLSDLDEVLISRGGMGLTLGVKRLLDSRD